MHTTDDQVKENSYFANRTVDAAYYSEYHIPRYLLPYLPSKDARVLDIGCGFGQFLGAMKSEGYSNLFGIDISDEALEVCRRKGLDTQKIDDIRNFRPDRKFDFIMMNHVLEHLEKGTVIDTLRHIREHLLAPGGSFVLMVPNAQSPTGTYWRYEDFTHHLLFTAGSCQYVLRAAGFGEISFIDPDGTSQMKVWKAWIIKLLLRCYRLREDFWGLVLQTSYHKPSPRIYSFEVKVRAKG